MIKAGIIGCGKIADSHAEQIQRIPDCEIVGVCDREILMGKQMFERYKIKNYYDDVDVFLEDSKPDVVHITTPPQSHFDLGKKCLNAGIHVYIEKPFTLFTNEAEELIRIANENKLKLTVGHDDQFTHASRQLRELIRGGYLGGDPVHMESYYCYDFGSGEYAKALLGNRDHWVRQLPGKLLHNVISHGICRIAEYVSCDSPTVIAYGYTSQSLKNLNSMDIIDELRVIISWNEKATAYFTFSSQMRPALHHFRIFGPKNAIYLDHDQQTIVKAGGERYKSYLEKFIPPILYSKQYAANSVGNVFKFIRNDFHMKSGMKFLIESFYNSIANDAPVPIPHKEIILTTRIMEDIFMQLDEKPYLLRI